MNKNRASSSLFGPALLTLEEVGQLLGIDRRAVWYIEKRAFKKIRKLLVDRLGPEFFED